GKTNFQKEAMTLQQAHLDALMRSRELLPLLVKRQGILQLVKSNEVWEDGDEFYYLLHDPRPSLLKLLSGSKPTSRLSLGVLPDVEEFPLAKLPSPSLVLGEIA
ncbi:MAG: sodium:proton antiporter, partial [Microcystaceae cyanobacterium]